MITEREASVVSVTEFEGERARSNDGFTVFYFTKIKEHCGMKLLQVCCVVTIRSWTYLVYEISIPKMFSNHDESIE